MGVLGSLVGNAIATFGCQDAASLDRSAALVISASNIQPWDAGKLVRERLRTQEELRSRCPLSQVPVQYGLNWFHDRTLGDQLKGGITVEQFVLISEQLLDFWGVPHHYSHQLNLVDVYRAIDYDGSGRLSVGELAAALPAFFKGSLTERETCVFRTLDQQARGYVERAEFDEYLRPLVELMVPAEASALKPLLMKHVGDALFAELLAAGSDQKEAQQQRCTLEAFLTWSAQRRKSLAEELQHLIETKVYTVWLERNLSASRLSLV